MFVILDLFILGNCSGQRSLLPATALQRKIAALKVCNSLKTNLMIIIILCTNRISVFLVIYAVHFYLAINLCLLVLKMYVFLQPSLVDLCYGHVT